MSAGDSPAYGLAGFVGREQQLADIKALLAANRLVTLTGPGGSGKTRLALQLTACLTADFPDGIFFVGLASIADPQLVVPAIAQELGAQESPGKSLLQTLKEHLRNMGSLLVLDNFEHLLAAAPQLSELLSVCPELKVLATSRAGLHLYGEQEYRVPPLSLPAKGERYTTDQLVQFDAVNLFVSRAKGVQPEFSLTGENAGAVADICRRLDGLPLAIELAAARVRLLAPEALLARLDRALALLTGGASNLPERQRTLRNAIAWSYDLLEPEEQRIFRCLSVFTGSCTLDAAGAVCGSDGGASTDLLDSLESLVDKSLLQRQPGYVPTSETRLGMLETIREYAVERLVEGLEADAVRRRHAEYFLALAEEGAERLKGHDQVAWLQRLSQEHDNIRAALRWALEADPEMALRMVGALWRFWWMSNHWSEGREWLSKALGGARHSYSPEQMMQLPTLARAFNGAAVLTVWQGDMSAAYDLFERGLQVGRATNDEQSAATALWGLGIVTLNRGDYSTTRSLLEESLALLRKVDDKWLMGGVLNNLATTSVAEEDLEQAGKLYEESLRIRREIGDQRGISIALNNLGTVALRQGDYTRAAASSEEALALARSTGIKQVIAWALDTLGLIAKHTGEYATAGERLREALVLFHELGAKTSAAGTLTRLADLLAGQGEPALAARFFGAAEAVLETTPIIALPASLAEQEQAVAAARAQMDEPTWEAAWAEGHALTLDQAVDLVMKKLPAIIPVETQPSRPTSPATKESPGPPPAGTLWVLTARELEVLRLVALGRSNPQVASELYVSIHTVEAHLRSVYSKLGVASRTEAARYAFENKLV